MKQTALMASEGSLVQPVSEGKDDDCTGGSGEQFWRPKLQRPQWGEEFKLKLSPLEGGKFLMQSLVFPAITHVLDRAQTQGIACHILRRSKQQYK